MDGFFMCVFVFSSGIWVLFHQLNVSIHHLLDEFLHGQTQEQS